MQMSSSASRIVSMPDVDDVILLEYICLQASRLTFATTTYVADFEPQTTEECPVRMITQYITHEMVYPMTELALRPVGLYKDPFRGGKHKIVLCELDNFSGKPLETNTRLKCLESLSKFKEDEPLVGFEQEVFFVDNDGIPFDWILSDKDCNNRLFLGKHTGFQRAIMNEHLKACLYAGIKMYGMNRESAPSEWEYQLAPLAPVQAGDEIIVSRYILNRLAEMHGVKVTFSNPESIRSSECRSTLHANLSTKAMRAEGGIKYINEAVDRISKIPQERMLKHYDLVKGNDYVWRLSGRAYMPHYNEFVVTGCKANASIRIPTQVSVGYFEERRASSDADPYEVCRVLTCAALDDAGLSENNTK